MALGSAARGRAGGETGPGRGVLDLVGVMREAGFEPDLDPTGTMCLRNCPYDALAAEHRDLTCEMNLAWAEGVVEGLGSTATARLDPEPGRCCVVIS